MTDNEPLTRRTVVGTLAVLLGTVFGISAGAAREPTTGSPPADQRQGATSATPESERLAGQPWTGIYHGTIDRIVDGDHVVILLESDGETVGQNVVDSDRVPDGEQGDSVTVWLFRGSVIAVRVD